MYLHCSLLITVHLKNNHESNGFTDRTYSESNKKHVETGFKSQSNVGIY